MQETEISYTTDDGLKFSEEKNAIRYERLSKLQKQYDSALREYGMALAETMKTADGYPFCFEHRVYFRPYCQGAHSGIEHVRLYRWSLLYDLDEWSETGELSLIEMNGKMRRHKISDLYFKELNAQTKLVAMLRTQRELIDDDIAKLETMVGANKVTDE